MKYSDKLNGFWEEGYHYYLEFKNDRLTVRDYRRAVAIETKIKYDAEALESGKRTVITLDDAVLSRDARGNPFTMIRELAYENGELKLLYYYTIMGETLYTLKKVDHGPFSHIIIRDDDYLDRLQGKWIQWRANGDKSSCLVIRGNKISAFYSEPEPFHVVSFTYDKDGVFLVPANLIDSDFRGYCRISVFPDRLTTRMMVCDADMPLAVFARPEMVDKIYIPDEAKRPVRNTMTRRVSTDGPDFMEIKTVDDIPVKRRRVDDGSAKTVFCPQCGKGFVCDPPKFCSECGAKLLTED